MPSGQKEPSKVAHSDGSPTAKKPKISTFAFVGHNRIYLGAQLGAEVCAHYASRPFGRCFLCKPEGLLQMLDASVLALGLIRGGELLVAESLVIGNVIDHPMTDSGGEQ
jgi:hypothetical protein